jgi:hypothetical protein
VVKNSYQIALLNFEFASFLKNAPLPELTDEEKQAYIAAINEKASAYTKKGDQYMETCAELSIKWEICEPQMDRVRHLMYSPEEYLTVRLAEKV